MEKAPGAKSSEPGLSWRYWLPRAGLIAAALFAIYWPALHGGWVWDDDWYVRQNPLMQSAMGLWKFWFRPGSWVEYYPIEETVHWLQWHFWGAHTLGYHLTNVLLQLVDCLLLWRLFARLGLQHAWLGGLLFAVHPAQVESVAWMSELKNVLSLPFFLLAMSSWIDFDQSRRKEDYQWVLFLYVLAMLCKIIMAPFPVVILLYAWWKRDRISLADLKVSAPFFAVAIVLGLAGDLVGRLYLANGNAQPEIIPLGGPLDRLSDAGLTLAVYFSRIFLPVGDLMVYPQWPVGSHPLLGVTCWLVFAGLAVLLWQRRAGWGRHALLGLGFAFLMLAPFLGFNAIAYMRFTWAMDHFLYLPLIGIIGLFLAAANDLENKLPRAVRHALGVLLGVAIILQAGQSRALASLFKSEDVLWTYVVQRNPNIWLAHHDLGCNLLDRGRPAEAVAQFQEVQRLFPEFSDGYYNMGVALDQLGRTAEARQQYLRALALNPRDDGSCVNLSEQARHAGDQAGEEQWLAKAMKLNPGNVAAAIDLADLYLKSGRIGEALDLYRPAVEENPNVFQLRFNYGGALLDAGQWNDAAEQIRAAIALQPKMASAHEKLGLALAHSGDAMGAVDEFSTALAQDPASPSARDNLGMALAQTGHYDESIKQLQLALKAHPDDKNAAQFLQKVEAFRQAHPGP